MYKAIIFDFYGVICSEIGSPWYKKRFTKEKADELKEKFDKPSNLGLISDEKFFSQIGAAAGLSGAEARKEWVDAIVINEPLVSFIRELKEKYKIAVCSNTQRELFRRILAENNLESLFDVIISSAEIGKLKPDPAIFEHTLNELGITPQEAIFVDDREENVSAAHHIGITGLTYTDLEAFLKDIDRLR